MILDLFGGPGGWSEACRELGLPEIGIEWDSAACATRAAAGHLTIRADVADYAPEPFVGKIEGLIASPPCQAFSAAGKRGGTDEALDAWAAGEYTPAWRAARAQAWAAHAEALDRHERSIPDPEELTLLAFDPLPHPGPPPPDPRGDLVAEICRWATTIRPPWIACEQVREVLPIWERIAEEVLGPLGYETDCRVVDAADFGVPQNRKRAILMASLLPFRPPQPTHAQSPNGRAPWVSMAEALRIPARFRVGFPRLDDRGDSPDGYRERDWRSSDRPSFTLTEKARSWLVVLNTGRDWKEGGSRADAQTVELDRPAPTLGAKAPTQLIFERPATTVQGDSRVWPPGHKINADDLRRLGEAARLRYADRAGTDALRLSVEAALVLQTFRPDYPVQGGQSKQFEQIGNAIPVLLARRIIEALI